MKVVAYGDERGVDRRRERGDCGSYSAQIRDGRLPARGRRNALRWPRRPVREVTLREPNSYTALRLSGLLDNARLLRAAAANGFAQAPRTAKVSTFRHSTGSRRPGSLELPDHPPLEEIAAHCAIGRAAVSASIVPFCRSLAPASTASKRNSSPPRGPSWPDGIPWGQEVVVSNFQGHGGYT